MTSGPITLLLVPRKIREASQNEAEAIEEILESLPFLPAEDHSDISDKKTKASSFGNAFSSMCFSYLKFPPNLSPTNWKHRTSFKSAQSCISHFSNHFHLINFTEVAKLQFFPPITAMRDHRVIKLSSRSSQPYLSSSSKKSPHQNAQE